jgi:hypothetical protein
MFPQVHKLEAELGHKLFPPNAWMKVLHFYVLTSCPKDELHQWFIGFYGEDIIPAIVHCYTKVLQRPDLVTVDKDGNLHPLLSNEAVARVFKRLADRLQGVVSDTSTKTITPEYNFGRPQPRIGWLLVAETEGVHRQSRSETFRCAAETRKARKRAVDQI